MPMIDPNDPKYKDGPGEKTPDCGPGWKVLAAVGFERYDASTGTPMLGMRFVCVEDQELGPDDGDDPGDQGHVAFENFALTEKALFRLANFATAIGWHEPFDSDDDGMIEQIMKAGYVRAELAEETHKGKTSIKIQSFAPFEIAEDDEPPEWADIIAKGEEGHGKYLEWRAKNPRKAGGSGGSGGRARGGGSGGGGSRGGWGTGGGGRSSGGGGKGGADDDIPFSVAA